MGRRILRAEMGVKEYSRIVGLGLVMLCTGKPRSNLRIRTHVQTEMGQYRLKCGLPAPYA
jgi:hypothetical protein